MPIRRPTASTRTRSTNIDTDGDYLTDLAFSYVFSPVKDGKQSASVYLAKGAEARPASLATGPCTSGGAAACAAMAS